LASIIPELQIGALIGIAQFKTQYFPQGIAICQNFRNEEGMAFAAVCLYGPGAKDPGGIFVGANFGSVIEMFEQEQQLMALSRGHMALSVADQVKPSVSAEVTHAVSASSNDWREERYDPKRKLSGRNGLKALRNAKRILRAR
jgi:hypothetical protein